ncbi:hypothetical protein KIN20_036976 [Parelaphostrongylus tenuis]|uniref:Uncharacterized protein n=1 Tax=Parelaphostrongylus tenuis TaxID=148309 RepID=A0AAD5RDT2_PARTN|nr:hypothetical protein KIN20_036976 [Parelaphostrongylus tenuis]
MSGSSSTFSTTSLKPKQGRFNCSILMLGSMGVVQLMVQWITVNVPSIVAQALILLVAAYSYEPEPPTPGDVAITEKSSEDDSKKSEFTNHRDAHYANMFTHAMQRNKELDMMSKTTEASLDAPQTEDVVLTPADPAKDKTQYEEKKKKEAEEYQKQFDKPFCC